MAKRGRPRHPDILTPREWEVLALLREGLSNDQIAQRLDITERTAKFHVSEILSKLGVATRQEAASWSPEERRSWWAVVGAPLAAVRRLTPAWTPAALAGGVVIAVGAGVGVLVWGLVRTGSDGADRYTTSAPVAVPTPRVDAPEDLVWDTGTASMSIVSMEESSCGDRATAEAYGVPVALELVRWQPGGGKWVLGLEAIPYDYVPAQVEVAAPWAHSPSGWELSQRPNIFRYAHMPAGYWVPEYFVRRLDQPSRLFRYASAMCDSQQIAASTLSERMKRAIVLPAELPQIVMHRQGDYISAEELIERLTNSQAYPGGRPVWLEMGNSYDFIASRGEKKFPQLRADPNEVVWEVLLDLGDLAGPQRPGWGLASRTIIDASSGQGTGWGCCAELWHSE